MKRKHVFILTAFLALLLGVSYVGWIRSPRLEADRPHVFVRVREGRIEQAEFTRFSDGSVFYQTGEHTVIQESWSPRGWRGALSALRDLGFIELKEAQSRRMLPADWQPSKER